MKSVKGGTNTDFTLHSVMKDYLQKFSPITPILRQDAKILDASQELLSQVSGVDYKFVWVISSLFLKILNVNALTKVKTLSKLIKTA